MWSFIFDQLTGWIGLAGLAVIVLVVVAFIFPQSRIYAAAIGLGILGMASVYARGQRDRARLEQQRRDEAVKKVNTEYDKIEKEERTVDHVKGRLKDGSF